MNTTFLWTMEQYLQGEEMPAPSLATYPTVDLDRLANSTQKTFSTREIDALNGLLGIDEISAIVISPQALALHQKNQEHLTEDESTRLKLVAKILSHVASIFGSNKVRSWLHEPFLRFGRRTPLDLMTDHEGAEKVEEYLVQIDEGYFA